MHLKLNIEANIEYTLKEYIEIDQSDREIFEMVTKKNDEEEEEPQQIILNLDPPRIVSFKEAMEGFVTVFEFFSQQSAASETFETDLDRLVEKRKRLE